MSSPFHCIPEMIAWINSLKHINTIRAILRFTYLDIFTTFLFLELSTKSDNLAFSFDDRECALSKCKPIVQDELEYQSYSKTLSVLVLC